MLLATDIQYSEDSAIAAGVLFSNWTDATASQTITTHIHGIAPYEPGAFYKRELPCILALLNEIAEEISAIVVDGYVTLGSQQKPGLGMYLFNHLEKAVAVVGVAKNKFSDTPADCEVRRGHSQKPLFVTAAGLPVETAKSYVAQMHGEHRIPTLLKRVDQLCRGIEPTE